MARLRAAGKQTGFIWRGRTMSTLEYTITNGVATIRLNNPEKKNAFTPEMLKAWRERLLEANSDDNVRVIVLTGAGDAFCSGGDTSKRTKDAPPEAPMSKKYNLMHGPQSIAVAMEEVDKLVIAAVNGAAVGAGLDMALMCDIRFAARSARFSEAYIRIGLIPGDGGCYYLPRIVGAAKALELLMTADFIDAEEALRINLVNRVYDDAKLMPETYAFAERIAAGPPHQQRMIKRTVYQSLHTDLRTSLDLISSHMALIQTTEDYREAVTAYKEKRKGKYQGR